MRGWGRKKGDSGGGYPTTNFHLYDIDPTLNVWPSIKHALMLLVLSHAISSVRGIYAKKHHVSNAHLVSRVVMFSREQIQSRVYQASSHTPTR